MHSLDDIADAIAQKTRLLLANVEPSQRERVLQARLQQLGGMRELAYWLEQDRMECKLDAQIGQLHQEQAVAYLTHLTLTMVLTAEQAWQYAQLLKRIGFTDYRNNARNDDEAYLMRDAGEVIRQALAEQGYKPR